MKKQTKKEILRLRTLKAQMKLTVRVVRALCKQ